MSNSNFNELLEKGKTYFANMSTKKKIIVGVIILLLIGVGMNDDEEKANPIPTKIAKLSSASPHPKIDSLRQIK